MVGFASSEPDPAVFLPPAPDATSSQPARPLPAGFEDRVLEVVDYIGQQGFVFEPWQVATFVTAVRTKPFVILAGISGTGKTKLPQLVAGATGARFDRIPVRPDWTDSGDLLGYTRLDNTFVPGPLLSAAKDAIEHPDVEHFVLLDEMNVARVEYYLAEVLSHIEDRRIDDGSIKSAALLPTAPDDWGSVYLPQNLCLVGSVNMDETTFGFSKKVLDRAFVVEFSTVTLSSLQSIGSPSPRQWSVDDWRQTALTLSAHAGVSESLVEDVVSVLTTVNESLALAQLQVGYRVRDEVAMFCLNAQACESAFVTSGTAPVDPLDIALCMKVLPRVQGGGAMIRSVIEELQQWAEKSSGPAAGSAPSRSFPFFTERLELMLRRLNDSGFASYWL
jgi:MoxR-like ATPase